MSDDKEGLDADREQSPTDGAEETPARKPDETPSDESASEGAVAEPSQPPPSNEGDSARAPAKAQSWLTPLQETLVAAASSTAAVIVGSMLAGSGSSVPRLENLALLFCILVGAVTWFLPRPKKSPRMIRIATWAGLSCIVYWLGPMKIAEVRAEHDLESGTRTEKEQAVERLVRLGKHNLAGADLRELNFSDADLGNVNLKGAKLNRSMLERTLLIESDLSGADLREANFRGANLSSATLYGAKLGKRSRAARCDRFTQLPAGFYCAHGSIEQGERPSHKKKRAQQAPTPEKQESAAAAPVVEETSEAPEADETAVAPGDTKADTEPDE